MPVPPGTLAALAGATVIANLSASNLTVGKHEYRRDLVRMSSAKNLAVQVYSAAGFGESTADLAWDGHGIVADRGEILAETARFVLTGSYAIADVDLGALLTDRMRMSSRAGLACRSSCCASSRPSASPSPPIHTASASSTIPAC